MQLSKEYEVFPKTRVGSGRWVQMVYLKLRIGPSAACFLPGSPGVKSEDPHHPQPQPGLGSENWELLSPQPSWKCLP